ncbi:hypothetical protein Cpha266_2654 [Chlorobium phaeobacteroides DSM 266]|uniref:Uncharacterized protein n=1 Tax=Chlorobium phaeobacteroides (strain DSM 266 / SMG 266 / 2430) TaxID=290317 RepID=A1BJR1_CHLPD|nr:hypothetical protein Cpha266_2654 [Chlorobium phaeobacteroides DSM 266]
MPTNSHEFSRKEIGSWFSLASPIKTTARFLIKRRICGLSIPYSLSVISTIGRDLSSVVFPCSCSGLPNPPRSLSAFGMTGGGSSG